MLQKNDLASAILVLVFKRVMYICKKTNEDRISAALNPNVQLCTAQKANLHIGFNFDLDIRQKEFEADQVQKF